MGQQCRVFEPFILSGQVVREMGEGVQVQGDVHWRAWQHEGKILVLAVNLSREPQPLTIPLPQGMERVQRLFEDQEVPVGEGKFNETLKAAGSAAYLLAGPQP
jgi:hypothetical protein